MRQIASVHHFAFSAYYGNIFPNEKCPARRIAVMIYGFSECSMFARKLVRFGMPYYRRLTVNRSAINYVDLSLKQKMKYESKAFRSC